MDKIVKHRLTSIASLIDFVKDEDFVFIQPHNFPDHDAVASAFGLQAFFQTRGLRATIVYDKEIQRDSLKKMIADLKIELVNLMDANMNEKQKIILVDGCKGNSNVTDLIGDEVGVIDHHQVVSPEDVEFSDIRPDYGACATIVWSYFHDFGVNIPKDIATAFMIGISMDTASLTRGVSTQDLNAFFNCFSLADIDYVNAIIRNYTRVSDLSYYRYLINNLKLEGPVAFCYFELGCPQNLLGILADFVLTIDQIGFVVLCAKNSQRINFSVRSETPDWDAAQVLRTALKDVGFGGGHADMAGGVIPDAGLFDRNGLLGMVKSILFR